jgi:signal transduction histidine kinase
MIRLGFASRLFIIFVTSLVALQVLAVAAYFLQRSRDTETDLRMPLPDQAAALVELLERMPKEQWPLVLRATSSTDLRVRISDKPTEGREAAWYEAPVVELILRRYLAALGGREVRVRVEPSSELLSGPMRALAWVSPGAVEIEVGLRTGHTLVVTSGGLLQLTMLGFPPGFWAGVLGFAVAVITVLMVRREARPLRDLAQAVDRMSPGKADAIPDAPRSAPEIRALIAAFNRLSQRIAQLIKARMALIGGISHDLRTYATRLRLRAELIGDANERAKAINDLDDMKQLLDDSLLAIEAGAPARAQELIEIAPILEREAEDRQRAGSAVALSVSPAARQAQLIGDALGLRRLIANLTDNALAYGREAAISADVVEGDSLVVLVDDKGPGISPAERELVLEPFVRLEQSRSRSTGGAGLGLAIARNVAEAHGGRLTLDTAPGGGTRAVVVLPAFQVNGGA